MDTISLLAKHAALQSSYNWQAEVALARRYYEGDQDTIIPVAVEDFLGKHASNKFRLNIVRGIVDAVRNRLNLVGIDTDEDRADGETRPVADWAARTYAAANLAARQADIHTSALRDRETFIILDWDGEKVQMLENLRYVDTNAGGDGQGAWIVYENDDPAQPAICAVKRWNDELALNGGSPVTVRRQNVYYPDRIEKYYYDAGWQKYAPDGVWPLPWVRPDGSPRGIPVIHFRNAGYRPEAWDAIPLQDVINQTLIDVGAANIMTAFRQYFAAGFLPTTDGKPLADDRKNAPRVGPGQFLVAPSNVPVERIRFDVIDGADNSPLLNTLQQLVVYAAQITSTPVSRFVTTAAIASAETLREQDKQLADKVRDRKVLFGDAWVRTFEMARKIANDFGDAGLDENVSLTPVWEAEQSETTLADKQMLGVPTETIWAEMGYDEKQIEMMRQSLEYRAKSETALWGAVDAMMTAGLSFSAALARMGFSQDEVNRLAGLQQAETIPPTEQ